MAESAASAPPDEAVVISALEFLARRSEQINYLAFTEGKGMVLPIQEYARYIAVKRRWDRYWRTALLAIIRASGSNPPERRPVSHNERSRLPPADGGRCIIVQVRNGQVEYWVPGFAPTPHFHEAQRQLDEAA